MPEARFIRYPLKFINPAGTSRGVLLEKESWFLILTDNTYPEGLGLGECSIIPGLSIDKRERIEPMMELLCNALNNDRPQPDLSSFPAIQTALEMAATDLESGGKQILYPSSFTEGLCGIPINGLIWMGEKNTMLKQVAEKLDKGFTVLKLKVGAIDFEKEMSILRKIREEFIPGNLEIRLDANGAWSAAEALEKLERLSAFEIHSIEQPIKAGKYEQMADICRLSPISVALDEDLIGISDPQQKTKLLDTIHPAYIILKPSLLGGISKSEEWIEIAEKYHVDWWITSALESNIGLNAIAQWTATLGSKMPQGLGTGSLYKNNIPSPLKISGEKLFHLNEKSWDLSPILSV